MNFLEQAGKMLMVIGLVVTALGGLLYVSGKLPFIGRLPGDILIQRKHYTFYFPLATGLLISVVVSLLLWLIGRWR